MPRMTHGAKSLKAWRIAASLNQNQVARMLDVRESMISHWECGRRMPNLDLVMAIEDVTDGDVMARAWTVDA